MSSGFAGAPVSRAICIVITLGTAFVVSNRSQDIISFLGYRVLGEGKEWWRLLTSLFSLESLWELFLCLHVFRVFRVLERHMGSAKFGSFLFLAVMLTKTTELALRLQNSSLKPLSGPHAISSALTTTYYGYIPSTAQPFFAVGDFQVTENFFTYAAVMLLASSHSWSSTVSAGCGVMMALMYWCSSSSPLQRFRVPGQRVFELCGALLPGGDEMAARRMRMERLQQRGMRMAAAGGDGGGRQRLMDDMFNRMPGAPVGPTGLRRRIEVAPPSEEDITLLMGLGFDRETVIRVLRSSGNNTEAAANILLGH